MYTYENITKQPLEVPNVGLVKPGEMLKTTVLIENPNLKLVEETKPQEPSPVRLEGTQTPPAPQITETTNGQL